MNTKTPRPKRSDDAILNAAAASLAPLVFVWCTEETPLETITEDLAKVLRWRSDGYELARAMDDAGYEPDAELVEILDNSVWRVNDALKKACEEWVKLEGLQAPPLQARVRLPDQRKEQGTGIIVRNHSDGTATVSFPDLGHIGHKPKDQKQTGIIGSVIEWERLEILPTP